MKEARDKETIQESELFGKIESSRISESSSSCARGLPFACPKLSSS